MLAFFTCYLAFHGCVRRVVTAPAEERDRVAAHVEAYRSTALVPARVPPPSVEVGPIRVAVGGVEATATLVRAEEAAWNTWVDGGPRLFNNAAALVFEVSVRADAALQWAPDATRLELNDDRTVVLAASSGELLLADLLLNAFLEERWALTGDLVDRTRAAGPFRAAYLPLVGPDGALDGVVAFPLYVGGATPTLGGGESLASTHVVALRLTLGVVVDGALRELVFVFE